MDVQRLWLIRAAPCLGFTFGEFGEVLRHRRRREPRCPQVRDVLRRQIAERGEGFDGTHRQRAHMLDAVKRWQQIPDGLPMDAQISTLLEVVAELEPASSMVGGRYES